MDPYRIHKGLNGISYRTDPYRIKPSAERFDSYRIEPLQNRSLWEDAFRIGPEQIDPHKIDSHRMEPTQKIFLQNRASVVPYRINPYGIEPCRMDPYRIGAYEIPYRIDPCRKQAYEIPSRIDPYRIENRAPAEQILIGQISIEQIIIEWVPT